MEGVNFGSFFSCINMAGNAAYKAVAKIGILGQKVSSYIQSFFASNHSKVNPEIELTTILKGRKLTQKKYELTVRDSFEPETVSKYENVDPEWTPGRKIVDQYGIEIGIAL